MPYTTKIESTKQNLAETKQAIKELLEKKASVTDAEELKAINKQINALQEEFGKSSDTCIFAGIKISGHQS